MLMKQIVNNDVSEGSPIVYTDLQSCFTLAASCFIALLKLGFSVFKHKFEEFSMILFFFFGRERIKTLLLAVLPSIT